MAEILGIQRPEQAERVSKQDTESRAPIRPSEDCLVILGKRPEQTERASKRNDELRQVSRLPEDDLVMLSERSGDAECASNRDAESRQLTRPSEDYSDILGQLSEQVNSRRMWKSVAIGLILAAFVGATSGTWLYFSWATTTSTLASSQEIAVTLTNHLNTAAQSLESLKEDLVKATATAGQAINQTLKDSLDDTKDQLQAERKRYGELQTQIAGLRTLLSQSGTGSPTPPDQNVQLIKYLQMSAE